MPRNPHCDACDLHRDARTRCIWGRKVGNGTEVMVIGESPGWSEDRDGVAFNAGEATQLLLQTLVKAGIENVYLTYAVKCKADKTPKESYKACSAYLDEEIAAVKPKAILALGAGVISRLGLRGKVGDLMGKTVPTERYGPIFPAMHPAAITRARGRQPSWEADIRRLGMIVRNELVSEPPVKVDVLEYAADLPWLIDQINDQCESGEPLSYDIEATYGLDWWHKDYQVYTVAFGFSKTEAIVLPVLHPESPFKDLPASSWRTLFGRARLSLEGAYGGALVAHNQLYDDLGLYRTLGFIPQCNFDTMNAWHLLDENSPKGLKWLISTLLGWPDYGIDTKDLKTMPLSKVATYNGIDAAGTLGVREKELTMLAKVPDIERYRVRVVQAYSNVIERMVARGVYVNREEVERRLEICKEKIAEAKAKIPVDNPASTKQVGKWLYGPKAEGGLGLPVLLYTPTGSPSTEESVINMLAREHPEVRVLTEGFRRFDKRRSTYFEPDLEMVENSFDGRAHWEYRISKTDTGRLASPAHTRPRHKFVRSVITATPGRIFLGVDSKNIEARLAAWTALGCPEGWEGVPHSSMLWAFKEGRDIYKEMAASALNKKVADITPEERQNMGKVPTLACIYKISPKGLQDQAWNDYELDWDLATATRLHTTFYQLWPELPKWHAREAAIIKNRGWTKSVLGRVRRLPNAKSHDKKLAEEDVRTGVNMPVQNLASDIIQAAHILLDRKFKSDEFFSVITVHDSIEFEIVPQLLEKYRPGIAWAFNEGSVKYLQPLGLKLPPGLLGCDFEEGPWGGEWNGKL